MARTKIFSVTNMVDGQVNDETSITFVVMSDLFAKEHGVVANPDNVTLAEKVFVQVKFKVVNDVDSSVMDEKTEWLQVTTANFSTLGAGFLAELKKIYDSGRTGLGLDPV